MEDVELDMPGELHLSHITTLLPHHADGQVDHCLLKAAIKKQSVLPNYAPKIILMDRFFWEVFINLSLQEHVVGSIVSWQWCYWGVNFQVSFSNVWKQLAIFLTSEYKLV